MHFFHLSNAKQSFHLPLTQNGPESSNYTPKLQLNETKSKKYRWQWEFIHQLFVAIPQCGKTAQIYAYLLGGKRLLGFHVKMPNFCPCVSKVVESNYHMLGNSNSKQEQQQFSCHAFHTVSFLPTPLSKYRVGVTGRGGQVLWPPVTPLPSKIFSPHTHCARFARMLCDAETHTQTHQGAHACSFLQPCVAFSSCPFPDS